MPSLTELLDKPIRDPDGEAVARLHDLVVRIYPDMEPVATGTTPQEIYPPVTGIVARLRGPAGARDIFIPWEQVRHMSTDGVALTPPAVDLARFQKRSDEIVLRDGLFDKQVVDVEGRRVVRINDLDLSSSRMAAGG